jgi:hypothetical protein
MQTGLKVLNIQEHAAGMMPWVGGGSHVPPQASSPGISSIIEG